MKKIIMVLLIMSAPPAVLCKQVQFNRSAPWQPSEVLIRALELQSDTCATRNAISIDPSSGNKPDEVGALPVPATGADPVMLSKAASAAADALLKVRRMELPEEYDSVWLDYQTVLALSAAGRGEEGRAFQALVLQPKSRFYEEQLKLKAALDMPDLSGRTPPEICNEKDFVKFAVYPEELVDQGFEGFLVLMIELKADQSAGRVWVRSSSHSGFEKPNLEAVKKSLPRFCEPQPSGYTGFAMLPFTFKLDGSGGKARQALQVDPIYNFTSTRAYRDVGDVRTCAGLQTQ